MEVSYLIKFTPEAKVDISYDLVVITEREKFRECGQKARSYFMENFRKEKFMKKLEEEFERIAI